jgi:methionyl-tRNA formyltransferase
MALRVVFFGTPAFALPSLDALLGAGHDVAAVITQPDRPKGRGHHLSAPPVKARALERGLSIFQPVKVRDAPTLEQLRSLAPDLAVVAAYGQLLPQALLDVPRLGFVNVHASLLPRWRGAAPVHRAILAGDRETGVTIMHVVLALDAGPMLSRVRTAIGPDETSVDLETRLADLGGRLLVETLAEVSSGAMRSEPQDEHGVTYAAKLERRDAAVDWHRPAAVIHNQIRGLQPWPIAATWVRDRRLLLHRSRVAADGGAGAEPGTVLATSAESIVVACTEGALSLLEVQPEGSRPMTAGAFLRGYPLEPGARFDAAPDGSA